jgi:histidine triad (HIT) family protein
MPSIFSRIIAGDLHGLVIPKEEVDHWVDLDETTALHLMTVARHVGRAQQQVIPCERIGLLIAGYEVPHTHVHVVPTDTMGDLDFRNADPTARADELDAVTELLRTTLREHGHGAAVPV